MFRSLFGAALAVLVLFQAPGAQAQVEKYSFDKAHTQILFFVNHLGFSNSMGKFLDYDGGITFDRTNPANSSVNVSIKTASIEMNDQKWNDHMKNEDFFNVTKFPTMDFKSTAIKVTGENTAEITGDLTILGVTKPVTLNATFNRADAHPFAPDRYVAGFSATTAIKRSEFGMNYGLPAVGDDVQIRIEVESVRDAS